jgi:DNA repair protein RadA
MNREVLGSMSEVGQTAEDASRKAGSSRYHSSGSGAVDGLLKGGFRSGTLTEIFGRSGTGKSQLAMQATLTEASRGGQSLFIDSEGSFRPERIEEMASAKRLQPRGLLDRIVYVRCDSMSEQMDTVRRMEKRDKTAKSRLVLVDTVTRNFSLELPGRANLSSRQGALDVHLSEMARDAYLNDRAYVLVNRVTFGPVHDVGIGGRTLEQLVHAAIRLEREAAGVRATLVATGEVAHATLGQSGVS